MLRLLTNIICLFYRLCESINRRVYNANICKRISYTTPPHLLGKIFLNTNKLRLGSNVTIYPGAYFWGNDIVVGDNVDIGIGTIIHSTNGVYIGDNTAIAGQCYIIDSNHGTKKGTLIREQSSVAADDGIYIGKDVWIAAQCTILKGAKINDHAIIGANSIVNCEIPANAIAVGSPAKVVKYRE